MLMRSAPLGRSIILILCAAACARPVTRPAVSGGVDASLLEPGVDTLREYRIKGQDTTEVGIVIDRIRIEERAGRRVLVRTYVGVANGVRTGHQVLIDDAVSLAPISHVRNFPTWAESLTFFPGRVVGELRFPNGVVTRIDAVVPATVFGDATLDLVLRASPLAADWERDVPIFLGSSGTITRMPARVTGASNLGGRDCWRVEASFSGLPVTFWVDQQSRRICQQTLRLPSGDQMLFRPW